MKFYVCIVQYRVSLYCEQDARMLEGNRSLLLLFGFEVISVLSHLDNHILLLLIFEREGNLKIDKLYYLQVYTTGVRS